MTFNPLPVCLIRSLTVLVVVNACSMHPIDVWALARHYLQHVGHRLGLHQIA